MTLGLTIIFCTLAITVCLGFGIKVLIDIHIEMIKIRQALEERNKQTFDK